MQYDKTFDAWMKSNPPWALNQGIAGQTGGAQSVGPLAPAAQPGYSLSPDLTSLPTDQAQSEGPNILQRFLAGLGTLENAVIGGVHGVQEIQQEGRSGNLDPADFLRPLGGVASGLKDGLDSVFGNQDKIKYGQDVALGEFAMGRSDPLGGFDTTQFGKDTQNMTAEEYNKYIDEVVKPAYEKYQQTDSAGETVARMTGGFAADVGFDPLTYVSLGAVPVIKKLLQKAAPEASANIAAKVAKLGETNPKTAAFIANIGNRPQMLPTPKIDTTKYADALAEKLGANVPEGVSPGVAVAAQADNIAEKMQQTIQTPELGQQSLFPDTGLRAEGPQKDYFRERNAQIRQGEDIAAQQYGNVPGQQEIQFPGATYETPTMFPKMSNPPPATPPVAPQVDNVAQQLPGQMEMFPPSYTQPGLFPEDGLRAAGPQPDAAAPAADVVGNGNAMDPTQREILFTKKGEPAKGALPVDIPTDIYEAGGTSHYRYKDGSVRVYDENGQIGPSFDNVVYLDPVAAAAVQARVAAGRPAMDKAGNILGQMGSGKTGKIAAKNISTEPQPGMVPLFHSADGAKTQFGNAIDTINAPKKVGEGPAVTPKESAAPTPVAKDTPAVETPVAKTEPKPADVPLEQAVNKADVSTAKVQYKVHSPTNHASRKAVTSTEQEIADQAVTAMFLKGKGNIFGFSREIGRQQLKNGKGYVNAMTPNGPVQIRIPDLVNAIINPKNAKIPFVFASKEDGVAGLTALALQKMDGSINPNLASVNLMFPKQASKTPITLQDLVDHAQEAVGWATKKVHGEKAEVAAQAAEAKAAQKAASEPVINATTPEAAEAAKPAAEAAYQQEKIVESPLPKTPEQPEHRIDTAVTDGRPESAKQFTEKPIKETRPSKERIAEDRTAATFDDLLTGLYDDVKRIMVQPNPTQAWMELTEKGTPDLWKIYNEQGFEALANHLGGRVSQGFLTITKQANLVRGNRGIQNRVFTSGAGRELEKAGMQRDLLGAPIPNNYALEIDKHLPTAQARANHAWKYLEAVEQAAERSGALPVATLSHKVPMKLSERLTLAADDLGIPKEWLLVPPTSREAAVLGMTKEQIDAITLLWKNSEFIDGSFDIMSYAGKDIPGRAKTYETLGTMFPSLKGNYGGPVPAINGIPTSKPKVPTKAEVQANPTAATGQAVAAGAEPTVVATINKDAADNLIDDGIDNFDYYQWDGGVDDFSRLAEDAALGKPVYKGGHRFINWFSAVSGHRNLGAMFWNNLGVGKRLGGDFDHWLKEIVDMKASPEEMRIAMSQVLTRTNTGSRHLPHSADRTGEVAKMIEDRITRLFGKQDSIMTRANVTDAQLVHYLRGLGVKLPSTLTKGNSDNYFVDLMSQMTDSLKDGREQLKFMSQFQGALNRAMTHNFMYADVMANLGSPVATATHTTKFGNHYFPPEIAQQLPGVLNKFEELNTYSANGKAFFEQIDDIMGVWKTAMTIPRPGHHVRNMVGDLFMSWLSNPRFMGNPAAMSRDYKKAVQILMHHQDAYGGVIRGNENLDQISALVEQLAMGDRTGLNAATIAGKSGTAATTKVITVGGRSLSSSDVYTQAFNRGLLQNSHIIEDIGGLEGSRFRMTTKARGLPYVKQMGIVTNVREHSVRLMDFVGDLEHGLNKKFKGRKNISEEEWNSAIKEIADKSAERVRKAHPDGLKLTPQERNYMRRLMPFYSYTRGIIPAVAEFALLHPGRAVAPMKAYHNAQQSIMGFDSQYGYDPNTPRLPSWMYENYGMGPLFSLGAANGGESFVGTDLYGVASYDIPRMIANPGDNALGMLSPGIKIPIELMSKRNMQTGQDITSLPDYFAKQMPMANLVYDTSKPGNQDFSWWNFVTGAKLTEMNKPSYYTSAEFEKKANG